jgi:hypothetical protein
MIELLMPFALHSTFVESTQLINHFRMNPFQQLFDKQKTYFPTDVTKSYAWRIDQLNRFKKLFIVRLKKFTVIDD